MQGINPKIWFHDLKAELEKRDAWTIFSGAACEQWINGELFRVVASNLNNNLSVYTETAKVDLTIHRVKRQGNKKTISWNEPLAIIENKVVYSNYYPSRRKNYFYKLIEQLKSPKYFKGNYQRIGFYIGIYANWSFDKIHSATKDNFEKFVRDLEIEFQKWAKESFGSYKVKFDHNNCMETLLEFKTIKIGGIFVDIGAVGQYFRLSK